MQFCFVGNSSRRVAIVALVAVSGGFASAAQAQSIRLKNATPSRWAQLPAAGDVIKSEDLIKAKTRAVEAAIAPINALPAPVAIAPAAPAAEPAGPALISLQFKDISVSDLVTMIAEQGNVGIIVSNDVDTRVKNVNLIDQTPEQAIRFIAETNGYKWRKLDARTYAIARNLAPLDEKIPVIVPQATNTMPYIEPREPATELPELLNVAQRREPREYAYLKIRNVTPRWIAWWLDPAHNPKPYEVKASEDALAQQEKERKHIAVSGFAPEDLGALQGRTSRSSRDDYNPWAPAGSLGRGNDLGQFDSDIYTNANAQIFNQNQNQNNNNNNNNNRNGNNRNGNNNNNRNGNGAAGGGAIFTLPEGIESLVAVDPQNALLVLGTPEGIQQLEQIIGFLDRPLRQVEIEAQFVTVSTTFSKAFGIDFTSSNGPFRLNTTGRAPAAQPGSISLGFVRNNFRATLNALEATGNAKTVAAPRVTAINNLPASITSTVATPITLTTTTQNLNGGNTQSSNPANFILTSTGLNVTPTINNDDTVTVVFSPFVSANTPIAGQQAPQISTQNIFTIANVKDGDTIALGGLRTKRLTSSKTRVPILGSIPLLGKLFESNNRLDAEDDLIIFLTARIIRRIDDPVPGT